MSILADGTIKRTIRKQAGYGPYLWAVVWYRYTPEMPQVSVYSFWEDAATMRAALQVKGYTVSIELATDNCRTFSQKGR